jgi:hypothetical protein
LPWEQHVVHNELKEVREAFEDVIHWMRFRVNAMSVQHDHRSEPVISTLDVDDPIAL